MLPRRLLVLVMMSVVASLLAGCTGSSAASEVPSASSTPATPGPVASGPLVTVETRGGECPQGACGSTIVIESDGRMHATAPAPMELGTMPDVTREGLAIEIAQADFTALKSRPFTGTCPVAFDGQETIYTFSTPAGPERIASCEFIVDPGAPLFLAVSAALAGATAP